MFSADQCYSAPGSFIGPLASTTEAQLLAYGKGADFLSRHGARQGQIPTLVEGSAIRRNFEGRVDRGARRFPFPAQSVFASLPLADKRQGGHQSCGGDVDGGVRPVATVAGREGAESGRTRRACTWGSVMSAGYRTNWVTKSSTGIDSSFARLARSANSGRSGFSVFTW